MPPLPPPGTPMNELPDVISPFLPPIDSSLGKEYTLVLDLDETLIHFYEPPTFDEEPYFMVRPGAEAFL
jgi:hypothetical protein